MLPTFASFCTNLCLFTLKSLLVIKIHQFKYFYDKIYTIGYYSGFYSSLRDKIWANINISNCLGKIDEIMMNLMHWCFKKFYQNLRSYKIYFFVHSSCFKFLFWRFNGGFDIFIRFILIYLHPLTWNFKSSPFAQIWSLRDLWNPE